jgi:hypothetical protein
MVALETGLDHIEWQRMEGVYVETLNYNFVYPYTLLCSARVSFLCALNTGPRNMKTSCCRMKSSMAHVSQMCNGITNLEKHATCVSKLNQDQVALSRTHR